MIDERELLVLSRVPEQYLQITAEMEKEVAKKTAAIESDISAEGFRVELKVKTGKPFTGIMTTAAEEKASLIVMDPMEIRFEEMPMGSVSENVSGMPRCLCWLSTGKSDKIPGGLEYAHPIYERKQDILL